MKLQIVESGIVNKTLVFPLPVENGIATDVENGILAAGVELDAKVHVAKNGKGGFDVTLALSGPDGLSYSYDVTEPAAGGVEGFLEGIAIGQGKELDAKVTLIA